MYKLAGILWNDDGTPTICEPIKCPYCGKSHYREGMGTSTCMYFPPEWKDGVNLNPDRNIHTVECECLECGKKFLITNGKAEKLGVSDEECRPPEEYNMTLFTDGDGLFYSNIECAGLITPNTQIQLDNLGEYVVFKYKDKSIKLTPEQLYNKIKELFPDAEENA